MKLTNVFLCIGLMTSANLLQASVDPEEACLGTEVRPVSHIEKTITEDLYTLFLANLFREHNVPTNRNSIYSAVKTATLKLDIVGRRNDAYLLLDGNRIALSDQETSLVEYLFNSYDVPTQRIDNLHYYEIATIRYGTLMCNPPTWSISYEKE